MMTWSDRLSIAVDELNFYVREAVSFVAYVLVMSVVLLCRIVKSLASKGYDYD